MVEILKDKKEMKRVKSWKIITQKGKYIKNALSKLAKKNGLLIKFSS